jgi:hypothetical protein
LLKSRQKERSERANLAVQRASRTTRSVVDPIQVLVPVLSSFIQQQVGVMTIAGELVAHAPRRPPLSGRSGGEIPLLPDPVQAFRERHLSWGSQDELALLLVEVFQVARHPISHLVVVVILDVEDVDEANV